MAGLHSRWSRLILLFEIRAWDGEEARLRLFEIPDGPAYELIEFIASGRAGARLKEGLEQTRGRYELLADVPLDGLDRFYRERLTAMHIWDEMPEHELEAEIRLEFSLR